MSALILNDATVLDCTGGDPRPHRSVLVQDGRITLIGATGSIQDVDGARTIACEGRTLMPGLTDAHVHFGLIEDAIGGQPASYVSYVISVLENMRLALDEGFTTVRDAGGLDPAYALAVDAAEAVGPRILPSGAFLTITGGHGDHRGRFDDSPIHDVPGLISHSEIVDGADEVRRAARRQLRHGATQVKLMASGGVMSPNDPLESVQFTVDEMKAAVDEARAFGKYAMAHCHTSAAINNALDAGVRSIEHGSIMDGATAARMAAAGAFLVPTLVIIEILSRFDGLPEFSRTKLDLVHAEMRHSVARADAAGVQIGSGSDLLGPRQRRRAGEIVEKAALLGPEAAILSATRTNAALFHIEDRIGTLEEGKDADLILVDGDPLADVGVLVDACNIPLVVKGGIVVKDLLG